MGMIKKATELAVLTDAQVALIAFGSNGKMTVYSSAPLARYNRAVPQALAPAGGTVARAAAPHDLH